MTTHYYNVTLAHELGPDIEVIIIPRLEIDNQIVSASEVRKDIANNEIESIKKLVPKTTYDFIEKKKNELQDRIKKGMNINGN